MKAFWGDLVSLVYAIVVRWRGHYNIVSGLARGIALKIPVTPKRYGRFRITRPAIHCSTQRAGSSRNRGHMRLKRNY